MKNLILIGLLFAGNQYASATPLISPTAVLAASEAAKSAEDKTSKKDETRDAALEAKVEKTKKGETAVSGEQDSAENDSEEVASEKEGEQKTKKDKDSALPIFASKKEAIDNKMESRIGIIGRFSQKIVEKKNKDKNFQLGLSCLATDGQYSETKDIFAQKEKELNGNKKKSRWGFLNPINWAKGGFKVAKAMFSWPFSRIGKKGDAEIGKVKGPRILGHDGSKVILGYEVSLKAIIDADSSDEKSGRKTDVKSYHLCSASTDDVAAMLGKDVAWVEKKLKIGKYAKKDSKDKKRDREESDVEENIGNDDESVSEIKEEKSSSDPVAEAPKAAEPVAAAESTEAGVAAVDAG